MPGYVEIAGKRPGYLPGVGIESAISSLIDNRQKSSVLGA
jgi:hypothetical protein